MEEIVTKPADQPAGPTVEERAADSVQSDDPEAPTTVEAEEAAALSAPDQPAPEAECVEHAENSQPADTTGIDGTQFFADVSSGASAEESAEANELAVLEAIVYVTDEPLSVPQIAAALGQPVERVRGLLDKLVSEFAKPQHGLMVREIAGGYKMATKPEHHEAVRSFVKNLNPPLKLSLAALETLAVIAYKQPITAPEIMEIRGVQGAGVLKTLLDRKLITTSGRKNVVGRPILYKTTKDFLVQFGLKDLNELPTLKEFEELRRLAFGDSDEPVLGAESGAQPESDSSSDREQPSPAPPEPSPEEPGSQPDEPESPGTAPTGPESPGTEPEPESPGGSTPEPNA